jgi:hypothetical protein
MNELKYRPSLLMSNAIMIFVVERHGGAIIGHDPRIRDSWMPKVATHPVSIGHARFGIHIKPLPIHGKQPIN